MFLRQGASLEALSEITWGILSRDRTNSFFSPKQRPQVKPQVKSKVIFSVTCCFWKRLNEVIFVLELFLCFLQSEVCLCSWTILGNKRALQTQLQRSLKDGSLLSTYIFSKFPTLHLRHMRAIHFLNHLSKCGSRGWSLF